MCNLNWLLGDPKLGEVGLIDGEMIGLDVNEVIHPGIAVGLLLVARESRKHEFDFRSHRFDGAGVAREMFGVVGIMTTNHDNRSLGFFDGAASRRNMITSLKEIITELNQKQVVGITPDGPKGPREKIKDGLISLIKKTDAVIIPLSYSAKIKIRLGTWDKFLLIFPFNKFVAVWGTPFKYNARVSFDKNKAILQKEFQRIENLSKNLSL